MPARSPFRAAYRPHAKGWTASVAGVPEVAAFGRTLESARVDLVGQLSRQLGVRAGEIAVTDEVALSTPTKKALAAARAARNSALEAAVQSQVATAAAVQALTDQGLSLRDCGYLLGISHGRVRQILEATGRGTAKQAEKTRQSKKRGN